MESHTVLTDADLLINDLLKLATERQPNLSKSWFTLAGACYKWGRKAVDSARCVHNRAVSYLIKRQHRIQAITAHKNVHEVIHFCYYFFTKIRSYKKFALLFSNGTVELSTSDKEQIQSLLPSGTSEAEVEAVLTIMCQVC